jgi:hypothetical protein
MKVMVSSSQIKGSPVMGKTPWVAAGTWAAGLNPLPLVRPPKTRRMEMLLKNKNAVIYGGRGAIGNVGFKIHPGFFGGPETA